MINLTQIYQKKFDHHGAVRPSTFERYLARLIQLDPRRFKHLIPHNLPQEHWLSVLLTRPTGKRGACHTPHEEIKNLYLEWAKEQIKNYKPSPAPVEKKIIEKQPEVIQGVLDLSIKPEDICKVDNTPTKSPYSTHDFMGKTIRFIGDLNNDPKLVALDVCIALELGNGITRLSSLNGDIKAVPFSNGIKRMQLYTISDVFALLVTKFTSKTQKFTEWLRNTVNCDDYKEIYQDTLIVRDLLFHGMAYPAEPSDSLDGCYKIMKISGKSLLKLCGINLDSMEWRKCKEYESTIRKICLKKNQEIKCDEDIPGIVKKRWRACPEYDYLLTQDQCLCFLKEETSMFPYDPQLLTEKIQQIKNELNFAFRDAERKFQELIDPEKLKETRGASESNPRLIIVTKEKSIEIHWEGKAPSISLVSQGKEQILTQS